MRRSNSLFSQVCNYINSQPIGSTFLIHSLYNAVDEKSTQWKRSYDDNNYCTRLYAGALRHAGVLAKYKKGTWTVLAHIPKEVTASNTHRSTPPSKRWKANKETMNETKQSETIIIYKVFAKHVEPAEVLKTQVSALLSTGSYFEDETDAWYFLSIGTGIAVQALKSNWEASKNLANTIAEETKSHLEIEEDEMIERLDGLLPIIYHEDERETIKYIYGYNGKNGPLMKMQVPVNAIIANDDTEHESLKRLLQLKAGHSIQWQLLLEVIEKLENEQEMENKNKAIENASNSLNEEVKSHKLEIELNTLTLEDIRGKQVYLMHDGKPFTGKVTEFIIRFDKDEEPDYDHIMIDTISTMAFNSKNLSFTKESFKEKLANIVDSL